MKKAMSLFSTLLMLVALFTACNQSKIPETTAEPNTNEQTIIADRALLTIETLEEYAAFLETMPNVQGFVTYDMIKEIGAFRNFVCLSYPSVNDYSHYKYKLIDETGNRFNLYIKHTDKILTNTTEAIGVTDIRNMRLADKEEDGIYTYKGFTYKYYDGKLNSVIWTSEGREFVLDGVSIDLAEYPATSENTFISKLLKRETAVAAVESIKTKVAVK